MNNLSWLIYLMGVTGDVKWIFKACTVVCIPSVIIWVSALFCMADEGASSKNWATWRKCGYFILSLAFVSFLIASLLPSRQTLILIAGSQIGEKFVQSETVQGMVNPGVDLLKTWIETETKHLKSDLISKGK